jgi:hypothetical protein
MPFTNGSFSFRQFDISGQAPKEATEDMMSRLDSHAICEDNEEVNYGWVGPRHHADKEFSFENVVYADALHFGLRIDTNKVPADVRKSHQVTLETATAAQNPSGFLSKTQKREIKDQVRQFVEEERKTGKYRRSRVVPVLWDLREGRVYANANGKTFEKLAEIFERTFSLTLRPISSGEVAGQYLDRVGRSKDWDDLRGTKFVDGPEGEAQQAAYPWVATSVDSRAFLGNEFLLWAIARTHTIDDEVKTLMGNTVALMFDKRLSLECVFGMTGKHIITGTGPDRLPETRRALASGKVPRKAGMMSVISGSAYEFTFDAESFAFGGLKLPDVEDAESPRVLFEERIGLLRDFIKGMTDAFDTFVALRTSDGWPQVIKDIFGWIKS